MTHLLTEAVQRFRKKVATAIQTTTETTTETTTPVVVEGKALITAERLLEFLDIELTERCNLCCHHCYIRRNLYDQKAHEKEMDIVFIESLLKEAISLGCDGVRFTGGEPLVRQDFTQIYLCAYSLDLRVSIATNATLITDKIADMFVAHPPEVVSISLYGWDEESYVTTVGRSGQFAKFLAGINRLIKRGIPFKLKYPPTKFLVDNSDRLSELAKSLGFDEELPHAWELTLHSRHESAACQRISACRMSPKEAALQRLKDPGVGEHDLELIRAGKMRHTKKIFSCRGAKRRLSIDPYGQLQPCLEVRHPDVNYDLRSGSLTDAVQNHMPKCKQLRFSNPAYLDRCCKCLLRPACPLCPACSWMENGDLEVPSEYHCQVMHEEAKILGLLAGDEKGWEIDSLCL